MNNKIVFKTHFGKPIQGNMLRLNDHTRKYIDIIIRATGLSASKVVEQVLEYAVENFEVEEY